MNFGCFCSKVLEGLGYNVPENELSAFIGQLDIDKSGTNELLVFIEIDFNHLIVRND